MSQAILKSPSCPVNPNAATQKPFYHTALLAIDPQACCPWPYHPRDRAGLNPQRCMDLIQSIPRTGQMEPVVLRALAGGLEGRFEIITGVRRWFACSQIPHQKLLARVIEADDRHCMMLMHADNAHAQDISDVERACSFAAYMQSGLFRNQRELAKTLGLSQSSISKMIKVAELLEEDWFSVLFDHKPDIPLRHTYRVSTLLKKAESRARIKMEAQVILVAQKQGAVRLAAHAVLKRLIGCVRAEIPHALLEAQDTRDRVLLEKDTQAMIRLRQDPRGSLRLSIDVLAKAYPRSEIVALCMRAIEDYLGALPSCAST